MIRRIALSVGLTASLAATAQVPPSWIALRTVEGGQVEYFVSEASQRFGPTLYVMLASHSEPGLTTFQWIWAHCSRGWTTDAAASALQFEGSLQQRYAEALAKTDRLSVYGVEFFDEGMNPSARSPAFKKALAEHCKKLPASVSDAEVPVASTEVALGKTGFTDYLLLRTLVKKGDIVEGWFRRGETEKKPFKAADGQEIKAPDGKPFAFAAQTEFRVMSRFKVSAKCSERLSAVSRLTKYTRDGEVVPTRGDDSKLDWGEPVPATVGESHFNALCRV